MGFLPQLYQQQLRLADLLRAVTELITSAASTVSSSETMIRTGMSRIAGLSGASAIALGAYGAHVLNVAKEGVTEEQRRAFEVANRYHLIHSVALLGVTMVRKPRLTGALMVGGMLTFCGTTYYHAFTGDKQYRKLTPYGGMMLIAAWLSMVL